MASKRHGLIEADGSGTARLVDISVCRAAPKVKESLCAKKSPRTRRAHEDDAGAGRPRRKRAPADRPQSGGDPGRALANESELSALGRLIEALRSEKIRFQVAGMMAAVLQGVPVATIDADLWIDLPPRQYIRVLNLCVRLGARVTANTVVELTDDTVVNFLYRVDGLASFKTEVRRALRIEWVGQIVKVLPLERIIRSK